MSQLAPPVIVCAANYHEELDMLLAGARHWDSVMRAHAERYELPYTGWSQGFIDQYGKFYTRKEAVALVKENGQPIDWERNGGSGNELYSEGLY